MMGGGWSGCRHCGWCLMGMEDQALVAVLPVVVFLFFVIMGCVYNIHPTDVCFCLFERRSEVDASRAEKLRQEIGFTEHTWPLEKVYEYYGGTPENGLSSAQVLQNRYVDCMITLYSLVSRASSCIAVHRRASSNHLMVSSFVSLSFTGKNMAGTV